MATTCINLITEVLTSVNQKQIEQAWTMESGSEQDQQSYDDDTSVSCKSFAACIDNEEESIAACDQTYESVGSDDNIEDLTSNNVDKSSANQVKEELWLGKRKFRETCMNKRVPNKPSKCRRVEKFVKKQPKDKLEQILLARGSSISN